MDVKRILLGADAKGNSDLIDLAPLLVEGQAFVAGGVFKDIATGVTPKDIDVFFYDAGCYNNAVERFRGSRKYTEEYSTPRSKGFKHTSSNMMVDLVCYQFGTPLEVISRFEFTVCKMAFYKENGEFFVIHDTRFHRDLEDRRLVVEDKIENPDLFFNRMLRYVNYGYKVDLTVKQRLFEAIQATYKPGDNINPVNTKY